LITEECEYNIKDDEEDDKKISKKEETTLYAVKILSKYMLIRAK
jgi:hypothetical protein